MEKSIRTLSLFEKVIDKAISEIRPDLIDLKRPKERDFMYYVIEIKDPIKDKLLKKYTISLNEYESLDREKRKELYSYIKKSNKTFDEEAFNKQLKSYKKLLNEYNILFNKMHSILLQKLDIDQEVVDDILYLFDALDDYIDFYSTLRANKQLEEIESLILSTNYKISNACEETLNEIVKDIVLSNNFKTRNNKKSKATL